MAGRNIKSSYKRDQILKIRISKQYKKLMEEINNEYGDQLSQADIIELALHHFAAGYLHIYYLERPHFMKKLEMTWTY